MYQRTIYRIPVLSRCFQPWRMIFSVVNRDCSIKIACCRYLILSNINTQQAIPCTLKKEDYMRPINHQTYQWLNLITVCNIYCLSIYQQLVIAAYKCAPSSFIIIMKLTFTNTKEHKNCLYFIKALHEIEKHNVKDNQRPVYMKISKQQIKLAPSLKDIHRERIENGCLVVIKSNVYNVDFDDDDEENTIYLIFTFKFLKCFTRNQSKVTLLKIIANNGHLRMEYDTQGQYIQCLLNMESQEVKQNWPESPDSTRESFYEIIDIARITQSQIKHISMKDEQQLWLQFGEDNICMRTVIKGKVRKQDKIMLIGNSSYKYLTLKNKLRNRHYLNLKGEYFLETLWEGLKKKKPVELFVKNIYDRYEEKEIRSSYLVIKTQVEYGTIYKIIGCYVSEQMDESGEEAIRREVQKERETKQSFLLKSEENNAQQAKRIVFNRFNEVDAEANIAKDAFNQRRPLGKIEEGQETFTRKYYSKF